MQTKRLRYVATLCIAFAMAMAVLVSCGNSSANSSASDENKVLRAATTAYGIDLTDDPCVGGWNYWHLLYWGVGETLFKVGTDGKLQPCLAESAEKTAEKTYVIKLRDNVKFSNGNDMTAEAVKNCLSRTEDAEGGLARYTLDIERMEADGQTLTIHTAQDLPAIESYLANGIFVIYDMPEGDDFSELSFTGPFVKGDYEQSVSRALVRNENYWDDPAKLSEIDLICYEDEAACTMALKAGEVDFLQSVQLSQVAEFEADPNLQVFSARGDRADQFWFNEEHPVAHDSAVKLALAKCLDRESIAENFYYGQATPLYGIWGDMLSFGGSEGIEVPVTGQDLEGAKKLLEEGGWEDTDDDGWLDKDGEKCSITIVAYPFDEILATLDDLTATAKTLGIEINPIVTQDYPSYEASGEFDVIWTSESTALVGTPYYYVNNFLKTGGSGNSGKFSNKDVDALAEKLMETNDEDEIADICKQITKIVMDDGHLVCYVNRCIPRAAANYVIYESNPCEYFIFDNKIDIDTSAQQ